MSNINFNDYKVKEVVYKETEDQKNLDEMINYLQSIVMDRSIDERSKVDVHKQLQELMRIKSITMPTPTIIVEKKEEGK